LILSSLAVGQQVEERLFKLLNWAKKFLYTRTPELT
jgi:hypothetical protein